MTVETIADVERENDFCKTGLCNNIKLVVSSLVVVTLVLVILVCISLGYCTLQLFPAINYVLMLLCLTLLAYVEALHYAVVAVEKWDMSIYKERYPRAVKVHSLVDTPKKVKKFLVGRQFFVIFVVFLLAQITTFPYIPANFANLPPVLILILIQTGLPGIALTLTFGQLISQIYVEEFTLQFLNMYGCEFVTRLSLGAEWVGVCNFSWLLYGIASRVFCAKVIRMQIQLNSSKTNTTSDEQDQLDPSSPTEKNRGPNYDNGIVANDELTWFDYLKYLWSTVATLGAVAIILYGISIQAYVLPTPPVGAYILAILALSNLFFLEGLMIAIVGTQYWDPETFKEVYPRAYKIHKLVNKPDNVKRFIIGRQFFTVLTNFLLAQIFTFSFWEAGSINSVVFFIVVKSGLVGVLTILSFGQLLPELLAAEYPLRFMDLYYSYTICYISLFFDAIGVGHCAWAVYYLTRRFLCKSQMEEGKAISDSKPRILRIESAEILCATSNKMNVTNV